MSCVCPQFKLDDTSYKLKPESVGRQVTTESVGRQVTTESVGRQVTTESVGRQVTTESVGRQVTTESVGRQVTTEHEETGAEDKGESHCKLLHEGFTYCTGQVSHQHQKLMSIGGAEVGLMSIGGVNIYSTYTHQKILGAPPHDLCLHIFTIETSSDSIS